MPKCSRLLKTQSRAVLMMLYTVSAVSEPCCGIFCGDACEGQGGGLFEGIDQASLGRTQELFDLRLGLFNWVEVRRVWRKVEQSGSAGFDQLAHARDLVGA